MNENTQNMIMMGFGLLTFIGVFYLYFIRDAQSKSQKLLQKAKKNNWITEGIEIKNIYIPHDYENNQEAKYRVVYEYRVHGKKYKKNMYYYREGAASIPYPKKVPVYYNDRNPGQAFLGDADTTLYHRQKSKGCLMCFVIPLFVMAIVIRLIRN